MTDNGPRAPDVGADWPSLDDAKLLSAAYEVVKQMRAVEGFAYTEDTYSARIPGGMLRSWITTAEKLLFRLRSELE